MNQAQESSPRLRNKLLPGAMSVTTATGCFIAVVCLSLFAVSGWQIWKAHDDQLQESKVTGMDLTRSLAQHADSAIKAVDTVLVGLVWDLEANPWGTAYMDNLHTHLLQQVAELPQLAALSIFDERGDSPVDSFARTRVRPNAVDREYFNYHRLHPGRGTHIGTMIRSRATGKWILPVSRRLEHRDGRFAGVVLASIDLDYFERFYNSYMLGSNGVILLLHVDSTLLVRRPALPIAIGTSISKAALFTTYLPRAPEGAYTSVTVFDHIEKLNTYRQLDHYPLIVVVAKPIDDILADWRAGVIVNVVAVSTLAFGLAVLGTLLLRTLRRKLLAESALLASERRIRIITDNLPLAIGYVDRDEKLQFANQAFAVPLRRSVDEALGHDFAELLGDRYAERERYIKAALAGDAVQFELGLMVSGVVGHFELRYIPDIDDSGAVQGFYSVKLDISTRKQLELEQQNAHRELQTIIDNMSSLVGYWDASLLNRFGNHAYLSWYGVTPDAMRGKHIRDVIGEDQYEANRIHIAAALNGVPQLFEERIVMDGVERVVVASYVPDIRNEQVVGFYAYVTDVTPLKQARNAQFEARAQLQGVIDAAKEFSIIVTDLKGKIEIFSTGAERMLGYSAHEMVGKRTPSVLHLPDDVARHGVLLSAEPGRELIDFNALAVATRGGKSQSGEWTFVRKDGTRLPVHLTLTAIHDAQGETTGLLGVGRDITEQKQLLASLSTAKEQAERASRAKSEFVANMSHEIRTPMNAVLGMAQLLGNSQLSSVQRKYLDMIQTAGKSLLDILNDILDFSKIEAGRMELSTAPFQLSDVLATLAALMVVNGDKKDLEIIIGVEPDVPNFLIGDAQRLQQILLNVAGNAVKFTDHGEVAIIVERDTRGHVRDGYADLSFRISDTGIGISPAQQLRLFSAFSQAEESTARRFGGTGLGLAICRRLAAMMGGSIAVTSEIGKGSQFRIDLTLRTDAPQPGQAKLQAGPLAQRGAQRVLVIDDNQTSAHYLKLTMRTWHWQVDVAATAGAALAMLQEEADAGLPYDTVLADWPLPQEQDPAAFDALRAQCQALGAGFITMVNPYFRHELAEDAVAGETGAILLKPVTASNLFDTFNEAVYAGDGAGAAAAQAADADVGEATASADETRLDGVVLLLVEDNPFNQMVAKGMLEYVGAQVTVVDNGKLALDHLMEHHSRYDMVLMDVQMPVMDGFMATRAIRTELRLDLPILAMSAGVMLDERDACTASGMNDFIPKPIEQPFMIATIRRHLPRDVYKPAAAAAPAKAVDAPAAPARSAADEELAQMMQANFDRMLDYLPDDAVYRRGIIDFIRAIVTGGAQSLQLARIANDEGRLEDAARGLHTMRGSIGTADGKRFAKTSLELEHAIKSSQTGQVALLFAQADSELTEVVAQAEIWLDARGALTPQMEDADAPPMALDGAALDSLCALLAQQNMAACDAYERLRPALRPFFDAPALAEIDSAIKNLAFARVLEKLADLPR